MYSSTPQSIVIQQPPPNTSAPTDSLGLGNAPQAIPSTPAAPVTPPLVQDSQGTVGTHIDTNSGINAGISGEIDSSRPARPIQPPSAAPAKTNDSNAGTANTSIGNKQVTPTPQTPSHTEKNIESTTNRKTESLGMVSKTDESANDADSLIEIDMGVLHPFVMTHEAPAPEYQVVMFDLDSLFSLGQQRQTTGYEQNDSIQTQAENIVWHRSLFERHTLQPTHSSPIERHVDSTNGWMSIGIIILGIFAYLYLYFHRMRLLEVFNSIFSQFHFDYMQRERAMHLSTNYLPASLICSSTLSMFLFAVVQQYALVETEWSVIMQIVALFLAIVTLQGIRNGILKFLGAAFCNSAAMTLHIRTSMLCQLLLGIAMLPFLILYYSTHGYHELYITLTIICIALFIIVDVSRGILIILTHPRKTNFYLIYYLCIVEIVPLIVLGKVLISL